MPSQSSQSFIISTLFIVFGLLQVVSAASLPRSSYDEVIHRKQLGSRSHTTFRKRFRSNPCDTPSPSSPTDAPSSSTSSSTTPSSTCVLITPSPTCRIEIRDLRDNSSMGYVSKNLNSQSYLDWTTDIANAQTFEYGTETSQWQSILALQPSDPNYPYIGALFAGTNLTPYDVSLTTIGKSNSDQTRQPVGGPERPRATGQGVIWTKSNENIITGGWINDSGSRANAKLYAISYMGSRGLRLVMNESSFKGGWPDPYSWAISWTWQCTAEPYCEGSS